MKIIAACLFLISAVYANDIVHEISNFHANIDAVREFHNNNIAEAHRAIMGLDLQAHHQNVLSSLNEYKVSSDDFETYDAIANCVSAVTTFGALVNNGCNAVFVIFNNSYTDVSGGHDLMAAHCNGPTSCHVTLSQSIAAVGQACGPVMAALPGASLGDFIDRLKTAIVLTEMPCIVSPTDSTKFCFEDVIALRVISQDPGTGTIPSQTVLAQYCTPCIFKLFSAAATFAPDYARVQFALMAANCWQFPAGGEYCVRKFNDVLQESAASRNAENGTSVAHLDLICHPCVRIFLRRVAILYADPVFAGKLIPAARSLFFYVHIIDAMCLARGVSEYCIREILPELQAGKWLDILPVPGYPCYNALVGSGTTCPACGDEIKNLTTAHGCCAVALYRFAGLQTFLYDSNTLSADNRDDPTFPANLMVAKFNEKCPAQATQIVIYCTAVAVKFRLTLLNIAVAAYEADRAAFHTLVIADIAEFLGMIAADLSIPNPGTAVQGVNTPWYSSFMPSSFVTLDSTQGVTLDVNINPDNDAAGADISTYLTTSLANGNIPFPNTASSVSYIADPTAEVTASNTSSASIIAASFALLLALMFIQL